MITWLQKKRKYLMVAMWFSGLSFIGAGFVGWGSYSFESALERTVGGEEITKAEVEQLKKILSSNTGIKDEKVLRDAALRLLVSEKMQKDYLKKVGLRILDSEVLAAISKMERFKTEGVGFDREKYFKTLKGSGITPKVFENQVRDGLYREYIEGFFKNIGVDEVEKSGASKLYSKSVSLQYGVSKTPQEGLVSEDRLRGYYETNKHKYKKEKEYNLMYVKISSSTESPTDGELESFYENNKFEFPNLGEFNKSLVEPRFFKERAKKNAQLEYLKLKKGKSEQTPLSTVVKDDGSFLPQGTLGGLSIGLYSRPIEAGGLFYIVKVIGVIEGYVAYESVREDIREALVLLDNKSALLTRFEAGASLPDSELVGTLKSVDHTTSLGTFGVEGEEAGSVKRAFLSKDVGGTGYFYSPALEGVVFYRISDISKRELSLNEELELEGGLRALKSRLYTNYFVESLKGGYEK